MCSPVQEETTSEYGTEDGSVSDATSQHSPRLYEDVLSDAIIKKVRLEYYLLDNDGAYQDVY